MAVDWLLIGLFLQKKESEYAGFSFSRGREGRVIYINYDSLTNFVKNVTTGDSDKNREKMLHILDDLKSSMDQLNMAKEKKRAAQEVSAEEGEAVVVKRARGSVLDLVLLTNGNMVAQTSHGSDLIQKTLDLSLIHI